MRHNSSATKAVCRRHSRGLTSAPPPAPALPGCNKMSGTDLASMVHRHGDQKAKSVCSSFASARLLYTQNCVAGRYASHS